LIDKYNIYSQIFIGSYFNIIIISNRTSFVSVGGRTKAVVTYKCWH
jgi:hypothetical protein